MYNAQLAEEHVLTLDLMRKHLFPFLLDHDMYKRSQTSKEMYKMYGLKEYVVNSDEKLQSIPNGTTHLIVKQFNKTIEKNLIPPSVLHIDFGWRFNTKLGHGVLPGGLQSVVFGNTFNQPLNVGVLPDTLQKLALGQEFREHIVFPRNLRHLKLSTSLNTLSSLESENRFRHNLKKLEHVTHLTIEHLGEFTEVVDFNLNTLPQSLTHLIVDFVHDEHYDKFNLVNIRGDYPTTLIDLTLGESFDAPFTVSNLPDSLTHLRFGDAFDRPLTKLRDGITYLSFGKYFDHDLSGVLPNTLKYLRLGQRFNQSLGKGVLPKGLQTLVISTKFYEDLYEDDGEGERKELYKPEYDTMSTIQTYVPRLEVLYVCYECEDNYILADPAPWPDCEHCQYTPWADCEHCQYTPWADCEHC